jgi:hypothetical protein
VLQEKLFSLFRRESAVSAPGTSHVPLPGSLARKSQKTGPPVTRQSRGLEQFFFNIRDVVGLSILDAAGANQNNIDFLTNLGHRLYSQDIVRSIDESFGPNVADQANPSRIEYFLKSNFDYPADSFDGVLLWDCLQFMSPPLLSAVVDQLYTIMKPGSYLLAFVTANERVTEAPSHTFRIVDNKNLLVAERGWRPSGQVFNNRSMEKLFGKFESVKFFLTRESLREVIVRR